MIIYEYKDGNRCYWTVQLDKTGGFSVDSWDNNPPDDVSQHHLEWSYSIYKSQSGFLSEGPEYKIGNILVDSGTITGQYNAPPHLAQILREWQAGIASVCMGLVEYAKPQES